MATSAIAASRALPAEDGATERRRVARWKRKLRFLVVFWLILCPMEAWAGPPFLTDDPQPVDFQHWEFYLASMDFHTIRRLVRRPRPHVEINYGVVPERATPRPRSRWELTMRRPGTAPKHYGVRRHRTGRQVPLRPGNDERSHDRRLPAVGSAHRQPEKNGLGNGRFAGASCPCGCKKRGERWTAYGGGGYGINSGAGSPELRLRGRGAPEAGVQAVLVGVEVYHQTAPVVGGRGDTAFNVGTVYDFSDDAPPALSRRAGPSMARRISSATSPISGPSTTASSTSVNASRRSRTQ